MMSSDFKLSFDLKIWPFLYRLRRYPHNQFMKSNGTMAGGMLNGGNRKVTIFVLMLLLLSTIPLVPTTTADEGFPVELQAQDIEAVFDPVSEETTITWRNIEDVAGNFDILEDLWDATYHVYRSSENITENNVFELEPFYSVTACDIIAIGSNPGDCRGMEGKHPGHSATYQVSAGIDDHFYYAVITELGDGNYTTRLDLDASLTGSPVYEKTSPIRSPFNLDATFNPATSQTTVEWINYNVINPILPEEGEDAFEINVWQTTEKIDRSNGQTLFTSYSPIATLSPTTSSYVVDIPPQTNREAYYSVTYLLKNWTDSGQDYQDVRFLSQNSLSSPVIEDNTPPPFVSSVDAFFVPSNGTGTTTIAWDDVLIETGEQYRIYRHGDIFNSTNNPYIQLIGTVQEDVSEFKFDVPFNTYGDYTYCVVVVDRYGSFNTNVPYSICKSVFEDSNENWVKEPTNVKSQFICD